MFCYCRLLRRVLIFKNRTGILRLQVSPTNYVYTGTLSTKSNEIISEKKLPLHIIQEVNELDFAWSKKRNGNRFKSIISQYFSKVGGSTCGCLEILRVACDQTSSHHEMIYSLINYLNYEISKSGVEFSPSLEEKIEALKSVLTYSNYDIIQEVCKLFRLNESSHQLKLFIDDLILQQKLVEATFCIGSLNLQHEYDFEKILFPLLLEGKLYKIKQCIPDNPNLHLKVAKNLDSLLVAEDNASKATKFSTNSKKIIKLLNKWLKWFNVPVEQCENLHHVRRKYAINVLIKRRIEQSVAENVWEAMVKEIVEDNSSLKEHVIYKLMQQNDMETTLKMVEKLNLNNFDITQFDLTEPDLENIADKEDLEDLSKEHFGTEDKSEHLKFYLSSSDIKYVDDAQKFKCFIKEIMNYDVLGIDTEWKPQFGLSAERLALMQIAVRDKVYILDMVLLRDCLAPEEWDYFMENIFGNGNIIKLGCGLMKDIQMVIEDSQGTKGKKIRITHILDMSVFYNKIKEIYPNEMDDEIKEQKNIGLSKLCELILGLPLNKEERLCDWEKRPLAESQLEYAALDALCVVQMYDKLKREAAEKNMNFDHLVNLSMHLTTMPWRPKKRTKGTQFGKGFEINKPIPMHQFKVVLDSALESQGKQLRQLGANVVILDKSDSPEFAVKISKEEDRILICTETLLRQVEHRTLRPNLICFKPFNKYGEPTSISSILHKLNVQLSTKNILSRCEVCNSNKSIKLSSDDMNYIQECIKNKDFTALKSDQAVDEFRRTLNELCKSGVNIKFKVGMKSSHIGDIGAFLCSECGTVQ